MTRLAADRAAILTFIEVLEAGFEAVVGERGLKLSGGERQRIAIRPSILMPDRDSVRRALYHFADPHWVRPHSLFGGRPTRGIPYTAVLPYLCMQ